MSERTTEEWGRVAVDLPGWRWLPGMAWSEPEHGLSGRMYDAEEAAHHNRFTGHTETINPDDPATGGCLLALLGGRYRSAQCVRGDWFVVVTIDDGRPSRTRARPSLGRACIAAAEALGRWPGGDS